MVARFLGCQDQVVSRETKPNGVGLHLRNDYTPAASACLLPNRAEDDLPMSAPMPVPCPTAQPDRLHDRTRPVYTTPVDRLNDRLTCMPGTLDGRIYDHGGVHVAMSLHLRCQ